MNLSRAITLGLSVSTLLLFSGCAGKLPPITAISPQKPVEKVNHQLTPQNKHLVKQNYLKYRENMVGGIYTLVKNEIEKNKHEEVDRDIDLSKENLYQCNIDEVRGTPEVYFHKIFLMNDNNTQEGKPLSIALNYNNVNEIQYFDQKMGARLYSHIDGDYGFIYANMDGLSAKGIVNYKCKVVPNTIF